MSSRRFSPESIGHNLRGRVAAAFAGRASRSRTTPSMSGWRSMQISRRRKSRRIRRAVDARRCRANAAFVRGVGQAAIRAHACFAAPGVVGLRRGGAARAMAIPEQRRRPAEPRTTVRSHGSAFQYRAHRRTRGDGRVPARAVGVDVEKLGRAPLAVAERYFSPAEAAQLRRCRRRPATALLAALDLKEAYLKAIGHRARGWPRPHELHVRDAESFHFERSTMPTRHVGNFTSSNSARNTCSRSRVLPRGGDARARRLTFARDSAPLTESGPRRSGTARPALTTWRSRCSR